MGWLNHQLENGSPSLLIRVSKMSGLVETLRGQIAEISISFGRGVLLLCWMVLIFEGCLGCTRK